jgi:ABC-type Fe3+-hydroxamate transport system substrate-binding protein
MTAGTRDWPRVVSLVPSATETLTAWGCVPIACTRFCERPDLPHVGGTKDPHVTDIRALAPDLVVVDVEENRREDFDTLTGYGLDVLALQIRSLDDVAIELGRLAAKVGHAYDPAPLGAGAPVCVSAFVPIWRRPWMALGSPTYGSSLLAHLGVANVCDALGPYPSVTLEQAVALRPAYLLAPSEPYPFSTRQLDELESVAPTVFIDGRDLFWWGARTPGAIQRLAHQLSTACT